VDPTGLDQLLTSISPALPSLAYLRLNFLGVKSFPLPLAAAMCSLTELELDCNNLTRLPPELVHMTAPTSLDVSANKDLQLRRGDMKTLLGLPKLHRFVFNEKAGADSWSQESIETLIGVKVALPSLNMGDFL